MCRAKKQTVQETQGIGESKRPKEKVLKINQTNIQSTQTSGFPLILHFCSGIFKFSHLKERGGEISALGNRKGIYVQSSFD